MGFHPNLDYAIDSKSVKLNLYAVFFKEVDDFLSSVLVQTTV